MIGLTPRQRDVLSAIRAVKAAGRSPTFAEFAREVGCRSRGGVSFVLDQLVTRGRITRPAGRRTRLDEIEIVEAEMTPPHGDPLFEITALGIGYLAGHREVAP